MIYIPVEIQLRMILEDIKSIKDYLGFHTFDSPKSKALVCDGCNLAILMGAETCPVHAPEFNNVLSLSALGDLQRFGIDVDLSGVKIDL